MIYRNEHHAIASAINITSGSGCVSQAWQGQHKSGFVEDLTKASNLEYLTREERIYQNMMMRSNIKRNNSKAAFYALVAKYGQDEKEQANAINELVGLITVDLCDKAKKLLIWLWVIDGKRRSGVVEGVSKNLTGELSRSSFFRRKKEVFNWLNGLIELVVVDLA
jgi:hypothetical protein